MKNIFKIAAYTMLIAISQNFIQAFGPEAPAETGAYESTVERSHVQQYNVDHATRANEQARLQIEKDGEQATPEKYQARIDQLEPIEFKSYNDSLELEQNKQSLAIIKGTSPEQVLAARIAEIDGINNVMEFPSEDNNSQQNLSGKESPTTVTTDVFENSEITTQPKTADVYKNNPASKKVVIDSFMEKFKQEEGIDSNDIELPTYYIDDADTMMLILELKNGTTYEAIFNPATGALKEVASTNVVQSETNRYDDKTNNITEQKITDSTGKTISHELFDATTGKNLKEVAQQVKNPSSLTTFINRIVTAIFGDAATTPENLNTIKDITDAAQKDAPWFNPWDGSKFQVWYENLIEYLTQAKAKSIQEMAKNNGVNRVNGVEFNLKSPIDEIFPL